MRNVTFITRCLAERGYSLTSEERQPAHYSEGMETHTTWGPARGLFLECLEFDSWCLNITQNLVFPVDTSQGYTVCTNLPEVIFKGNSGKGQQWQKRLHLREMVQQSVEYRPTRTQIYTHAHTSHTRTHTDSYPPTHAPTPTRTHSPMDRLLW